MVQRCIDAVAGSSVTIAILPAGTANLLATNLGIPKDLAEAVAIGLHGSRRFLDVGVLNGERFAVMAGAGFDARIMGGLAVAPDTLSHNAPPMPRRGQVWHKCRSGMPANVSPIRRSGTPVEFLHLVRELRLSMPVQTAAAEPDVHRSEHA
jgi:hypothetical protein